MMTDSLQSRRSSRRATATVAALLATGLSLVAVTVVAIVGFAVEATERDSPGPDLSGGPRLSDGEAARLELATRPMPRLPLAAAAPQPLAPPAQSSSIKLPPTTEPEAQADREGAVAALIALSEVGLRGGDPEHYRDAYERIRTLGSPPSGQARMTALLTSMRSKAGLPASGPVPGLEINYRVSQAQIKGSLESNRFVVVCVLGQFDAAFQGMFTSHGVGDCQALELLDGRWRIAAGPPAAQAPDAWPGSTEARAAGYVEVVR